MLKKYDNEYLLAELKKGFNSYIKKKPSPTSRSNKYYMNFLGQEIQLYMFEPEDLNLEKQMVKELIEGELIYEILNSKKPTHGNK